MYTFINNILDNLLVLERAGYEIVDFCVNDFCQIAVIEKNNGFFFFDFSLLPAKFDKNMLVRGLLSIGIEVAIAYSDQIQIANEENRND